MAVPRRTVLTHSSLFLLLSAFLLSGCRPTTGPGGPLSVPPPGELRLVTRRIEQTPDRIHWKWSILGDRCWKTAGADNASLSLNQSYPLNDPSHLHGTNVWECDLTAERTHESPNQLSWSAVLHGSNGITATYTAQTPLKSGEEPDNLVRVAVDHDLVTRAPANVTLATIGDTPLSLKTTN